MSASVAVLGTKNTCLRLINALHDANVHIARIVTIDDSGDTRSVVHEITETGLLHGIDTLVAPTVSHAYSALIDSGAAVVIVAGWYRIIPDRILDAVTRGWVGVHYSKLPSYRGSAPVVWALINGEKEIGYSIFRMTAGMDEGPVAGSGTITVDPDAYVSDVLDALDVKSLAHLARIAQSIAEGNTTFVEQSSTGLSYGGARNPTDGRIDWSLPAQVVARHVRAQSHPYPGAHTLLQDETVHVWRASEDADIQYFGQPGQVVRMVDGKPVVTCGGGTGLILDEIEPAELKFSLLTSRFR